MNMQQCPNGHFYDQSKTHTCPYCSPATESSNRTIPLDNGGTAFCAPASSAPTSWSTQSGGVGSTAPVANPMPAWGGGATIGHTAPVSPMSDERRTVALMHNKIGLDPVVGWLVCVEGKEKGRDYRFRSGNNSLGRSDKMDICVLGDDTVSREDAAFIIYDPHSKKYLVSAGTGKSLVYVNDDLLPAAQSRQLASHDRITIGETTLMFVPFCGEEFDWA